jgi:hypothetical protein
MLNDFNVNWNSGDELIHFCGNVCKKAAAFHTEKERRTVCAEIDVKAAVRM